jgi:hypothetical protein
MNRTCANCACSLAVSSKDGSPVDVKPATKADTLDALGNPYVLLMCRRNQPGGRQVRMQREMVIMKDGKPTVVTDKNGRPRIEEYVENQFGWGGTMPELVCFDGWRPEGTPPGGYYADPEGIK